MVYNNSMRNKEWVYIILNLIATIFYFIAFFNKNMTYLGIGGSILILNSIINTFPIKKNKR